MINSICSRERLTLVNRERLKQTFLDLVIIDSPSKEEEEIARYLQELLQSWGFSSRRDEIGNLVAVVPGEGAPLLLNAHLDTVVPGKGVKPRVEDGIVYSDGTTVLGGDDKSGVAAILELLQILQERQLKHLPLEIVFTVQEEIGLFGSKAFDFGQLQAREGMVLDGSGSIEDVTVAAPAQDGIKAVVHGKSAHAGVAPEQGINAILVAAEAITQMPLGRIDEETTSNVGVIQGGAATNIVPDHVELRGEARSHSSDKLEQQTMAMKTALENAARKHGATVDITVNRTYERFRVAETVSVVQKTQQALRKMGYTPNLQRCGGGSDANIFNSHGIASIIISTGMSQVHTVNERIAIADIERCAKLLLEVVTA